MKLNKHDIIWHMKREAEEYGMLYRQLERENEATRLHAGIIADAAICAYSRGVCVTIGPNMAAEFFVESGFAPYLVEAWDRLDADRDEKRGKTLRKAVTLCRQGLEEKAQEH